MGRNKKRHFKNLSPIFLLLNFYKHKTKAEKRVLFEGFKYMKGGVYSEYEIIKTKDLKGKTIEDLISFNLTLTKNAIDKFKI